MSDGQARSAHVFQPVVHPELTRVGQAPIQVFLQARDRYLLIIQEANKTAGVQMTPTTVMASMDPDLLLNLIDLGEIQGVSSLANCNDDAVIKHLQGTQDQNPQLTAEDLEREVKAKVQYRLSEKNPELRVTSAVGDLLTLLRRINMKNFIKDNPKKAIKLVVTILQPSGFKELIESDLALLRYTSRPTGWSLSSTSNRRRLRSIAMRQRVQAMCHRTRQI
jgi:hypothetical protein